MNPTRSAFVRLTALAAVGAVIVVFSAQAGIRASGANLLQNGNAEAAPGATDNSIVPPPGWTTTGSFTAIQYGANGAPAAVPGGGGTFFAGGPGDPVSTATQTVDVSSSAAAIDAGTAQATLSALLGGWDGQEDSATVEALFLSSAQVALGSVTIGPVTAGDRADRSTLLPRSQSGSVPPGTRSISVIITATRSSGVYNDGYADNVSLTLSAGKPTRASYRFGFRIADRRIALSAGSSGSFATEGQPSSSGDARVVGVAARDLGLAWNYRGKRYVVTLRFTGDGSYDPASQLLGLHLQVRNSTVPGCHAGSEARILVDKPGDVNLYFCGEKIEFMAPTRSSAWVRQTG